MARVTRPPSDAPWWARFTRTGRTATVATLAPPQREQAPPVPPPPVLPIDVLLPVPTPDVVGRQPAAAMPASDLPGPRPLPTGNFTVPVTPALLINQASATVRITVVGNGPITLQLGRAPGSFGDGLVLQPGDFTDVPTGTDAWGIARPGQPSAVSFASLA